MSFIELGHRGLPKPIFPEQRTVNHPTALIPTFPGTASASSLPLYVGLDYHSRNVQACLMNPQGEVVASRNLDNDLNTVCDFLLRSAQACNGHVAKVAIEACTGAADFADALTEQAGLLVELAHPLYVHHMKKTPDKSDYDDARLLADLTRVGYLPRTWRAPLWVRELRQLVRYRQQHADARRSAKLRVSALLREHRLRRLDTQGKSATGRAWSKSWLKWLEEQALPAMPETSRWVVRQHLLELEHAKKLVALAEQKLGEYIAADEVTQRLMAMPQLGLVTACVLRAEVGRFDRFRSGKSLSKYCGVTPRNASSGLTNADGGVVVGGSRLLKATLNQLAHRLGMHDLHYRAYRRSLMAAGKSGPTAAVAVANRWTRRLHAVMNAEPGAVPVSPPPGRKGKTKSKSKEPEAGETNRIGLETGIGSPVGVDQRAGAA
jgi:transposase